MKLTPDQTAALAAPLSREHVKQRTQSGRSLSYIEGWHAIAEANRIFGFDGWNRELQELTQLVDTMRDAANGNHQNHYVAYRAIVRVTVGTIVREGVGYGEGIDRFPGQAHESAIKEAETDAMKRALMTFGNQFGLALYDKQQREVAEQPAPSEPKRPPSGNQAMTAAVNRLCDITGMDKPGLKQLLGGLSVIEVDKACAEAKELGDVVAVIDRMKAAPNVD